MSTKITKYDCPTCGQKEGIEVGTKLDGSKLNVFTRKCKKCKNNHVFECSKLIKYEI